jgi:predicted HicB family RNase H-like nuclease
MFMSTDAKRRGNERYLEKLERVVFRLHKDGSDGVTKQQIEARAAAAGQSVNAWIIDAIKDKI